MTQSPNIPIELTSFVGRKRELAEVLQLLESSPLLTLTGTAGCGKTRLALRLAAILDSQAASPHFTDGVCWVGLAPLSEPQLVQKEVAKKLGVAEQPDRSLIEGVLDQLNGKQLLLVLDNCEHLVHACARLVETLIRLPGVRVLATSREALGVAGERRYPLVPMRRPPTGLSVTELSQFDAVRLFIERARLVIPTFALTPDNAAAVARICRQLDGLPLAIELACARIDTLSVEQIGARLKDRFRWLDETLQATSSQHLTLRAALDWSFDLLPTPEQTVLRRLSVFVGGCSLAAAEAVCAWDETEREQMLERLSALISKSLVVSQTLQRTEARYIFLETVRQYAQEKLIASGEAPAVKDRLLQHFLLLAEETVPKLSGSKQQLWLDRLEDEYENIRAALTWSLEEGRIEEGLRLAIALYPFFTIRDYVVEGLAWLERFLEQADERVSPVLRANGLAYAAFLAGFRQNTEAQMKYAGEAAALAEAAGEQDKPALRWALSAQAYYASAVHDFERELRLGQRVIQLNREVADNDQLGTSLMIYSYPALALEKYDLAREMLDESLALQRQAGNAYRIAMALNLSGDLRRCQRNYRQARLFYEESISILRELEAVRDLASALHNLGYTCLHLGEVERARDLLNESISMQQAQWNTPGMAECLLGFAALAVECGLPAAAGRLLAAAVAIGGQRIATSWAATRMEYEYYLALVRSQLDEEEFLTEQAVGSALSLEQALVYVENLPLEGAIVPVRQKKPDDLSSREREVAILIARGKSNGEIAEELVVSKRTIEKHIANIRSKLGFTQRSQIVRWAIETGLAKTGS